MSNVRGSDEARTSLMTSSSQVWHNDNPTVSTLLRVVRETITQTLRTQYMTHFESNPDLFRRILTKAAEWPGTVRDEELANIRRNIDNTALSPETTIESLWDAVVRAYTQHAAQCHPDRRYVMAFRDVKASVTRKDFDTFYGHVFSTVARHPDTQSGILLVDMATRVGVFSDAISDALWKTVVFNGFLVRNSTRDEFTLYDGSARRDPAALTIIHGGAESVVSRAAPAAPAAAGAGTVIGGAGEDSGTITPDDSVSQVAERAARREREDARTVLSRGGSIVSGMSRARPPTVKMHSLVREPLPPRVVDLVPDTPRRENRRGARTSYEESASTAGDDFMDPLGLLREE